MSNGKWSQKRLLTFSTFFVATIYVFAPLVKESFDVKEFVFLGFLTAGGFSLFRTQVQKQKIEQ